MAQAQLLLERFSPDVIDHVVKARVDEVNRAHAVGDFVNDRSASST